MIFFMRVVKSLDPAARNRIEKRLDMDAFVFLSSPFTMCE